ncbi:MAG: DUF2185 domain-containing protein [Labedaea sp.]
MVGAVAVRGVPTRRPLRVLGTRMDPDGPDADRWHSVWVECAAGEPARSVECGLVLVDEARLMFADPTALNAWRNDDSYDGLADLMFWRRDAETEREAVERYDDLVTLRAPGELVFRLDLQPHDDHHRVLQVMYTSSTESGSIEVAGAAVTGWFTSWGDGAFPVYRDLAEDGTLLRVRVELGAPEIVGRQRQLERLWFGDLAKLAMVSARVAREGSPVTWLYREAPDNDRDSGWRVFAGDESQTYLDDPAQCVPMPLRELIKADRALEDLFDRAAPIAFERATPDTAFVTAPVPDS